METAPLKSFATWARTALIREVSARISVVLASEELRQEQPNTVAALEKAVIGAGGGGKGRDMVADKVAYTWFNRIVALRFMDANGYTGIGVVSPEPGRGGGQPEVLAEAKRGNIDSTVVTNKRTVETVTSLLNGTRRSDDPQGEAYALLLAEYCRYWNRSMPFMFEQEGDYTELLIPANVLADDSVLARAAIVLTTEVCQDVEVIGWLYQFYISERKAEVFAGFKTNKKAGAAEIPAATQLFTPHWIVRYLVENSLGRLWLLNRPTSRLAEHMDYYIAPVDEETDYRKVSSPEELTVLDPACGSGHMLTYAFDLLYTIYEEEGYAPSDIPTLILAHNLYGTEIDPRAGALAAFALTMKARARQRTFFSKGIQPIICVLEPIHFDQDELDLLAGGQVTTSPAYRDHDRADIDQFWNAFEYADTFGSLIQPREKLIAPLERHLQEHPAPDGDMLADEAQGKASRLIQQAKYLSKRYSVVVANPPYMGNTNMEDRLSAFAKEWYPATKTDLYSMFMERVERFAEDGGSWGVICLHGWMFQSSFVDMRRRLLGGNYIATLTQFGRGVFGSDFASVAFVCLRSASEPSARGTYKKLFERALDVRQNELLERLFLDPAYQTFIVRQTAFLQIEEAPIAFDLGQEVLNLLTKASPLSSVASPKQGLITGDNNRFMRYWWEVSEQRVCWDAVGGNDLSASAPWSPYLKGGPPRRWYGNQLHVVLWAFDGEAIRNYYWPNGRQRSRPQNTEWYFRPGITWSTIAGEFAARDAESGSIFDQKGSLMILRDDKNRRRLLGYLNSRLAGKIIATLSPTLDFSQGPVGRIPVPDDVLTSSSVDELIDECVDIAKKDWDEGELSADFVSEIHTSRSFGETVAQHCENRLRNAVSRVERMQQLEASLDTHYLSLATSQKSALSEARIPTLTALQLSTAAPRSAVRSLLEDLISYAVGCMFGRYSLDKPGLILANQGDTLEEYLAKIPSPTFMPDKDNVIPIVDGDWFEDDIVARFRQFLRATFGEQHFEENLRFIIEYLDVKDLRDYFVRSFYKGHVQRYKKRPIYWLFSSPKGSFNALIYIHRYTPSSVSTVLNEYLREFKAKLEASRQHHERLGAGGGTPREKAAALKEVDRLRKVLLELDEYEHDVLYPLATQQVQIDLDDGVKANYPKLGAALKKIPGLEVSDE